MRLPVVLPMALVLSSCGTAASRAPVAHAAAVSPSPAASPVAVSTGTPAERGLPRSAVHAAVAQGLGYFLQHVELADRPVFAAHRFHGFRIARLRDSSFWDGVDLKPGDVITGVNGFPIERPEEALTVFESLEVASELRVQYEREGVPRELVYAILDDR